MPSERFSSFEEFWPYYLGEHKLRSCRALHYVGTTLALLNMGALLVTLNPWFILSMLLSSYGCAWVGHFVLEKNRPATFTYPFWSLAGDFHMYSLALRGQIQEEQERLAALAAPKGLTLVQKPTEPT